jgi:hypothetical protein
MANVPQTFDGDDVMDINQDDATNTLCCVGIVDPCYANMFLREQLSVARICTNYFSYQPHITSAMRIILVDWLISIHHLFKLLPETLFDAIFLLDKYLELQLTSPALRNKLQLIGATAMMIAAKLQELYPPEANDFLKVGANTFTLDQLFEMEMEYCQVLKCSFSSPSMLFFTRRFSKAAQNDYRTHTVTKYLLEICLHYFVNLICCHRQSELAAACCWLAKRMTSQLPCWTPTLVHYTTYTEETLKPIIIKVNDCLIRYVKTDITQNISAVYKKYSDRRYGQVANIAPIETSQLFQ